MTTGTSTGDFPTLLNYTSTSNTYTPDLTGKWAKSNSQPRRVQQNQLLADLLNHNEKLLSDFKSQPKEETIMAAKSTRRVVRVYILDPDERVPLDQALLHKGDEELTEMEDSELFYQIEIKKLLDTHNEKRKKIIDKKASERAGKDIYLDPVRIRDLVMTVVDVARF